MQYMLIHVLDGDIERGVPCTEPDLASWLGEAISAGVDLHGSPLRPPVDATTVRARHGELLITDGPFAETKEQVAGYDVIDCADTEELQWAAKHPSSRVGTIEVRPLRGAPVPAPLPPPRDGKTRYVLFIGLGEDFEMGEDDTAAMGPATDAWVKEMDGAGVRLFGSRLEGVDQAKTVRRRDDRVLVTDGPFIETKEMIAGFDVLECADLDEAIEVAAQHPMVRCGVLELRPLWPLGE